MSNAGQHIFVFVVCGGREHIETLHFSLQALQRFSRNPVWVLTDSRRNEIPVTHKHVIDVQTPAAFNNHQASIYLKTSIHRHLPGGNNYCYLDTDVVALSTAIDSIFELYQPPVMFATDHCVLNEFSPAAVNCNCRAKFDADNSLLRNELAYFNDVVLPQLAYIDNCLAEIETLVAQSKANAATYWWHRLCYSMPVAYYKLNHRYKLHKASGRWYDEEENKLWYEHRDNIRYAEEKTGFRYNRQTSEWVNKDGNSLGILTCNHLADAVKQKFNIAIQTPGWQHWNGGVFLFTDLSATFLDTWHELTMQAFADSYWKTRDQGTLAATVWKHNLQNHATLPIAYNFIADYNRATTVYKGGLTFLLQPALQTIKPVFIHIYHHWGDDNWPVWHDVKQYLHLTNAGSN